MYNKIKNPVTGRFVNTKGIIGKNILKNYLYQTQDGGGWFDWLPGMGGTEREKDTEVVNENAELINNTITDFENKIREWSNMHNVNQDIRSIDIENLREDIQTLKNKHNKLGARAGKQDGSEQKVHILQENSEKCKVKLSEIKERHVEELEDIQGECSGIDETLRVQQQREAKWETESKSKISNIKSEISQMRLNMDTVHEKLVRLSGGTSLEKSASHLERRGQPRDSQGRWQMDEYGLAGNPYVRENMRQWGGRKKLKNKKKRRN